MNSIFDSSSNLPRRSDFLRLSSAVGRCVVLVGCSVVLAPWVARAATAPQPRLAGFYEARIGELEPIATAGELDLWAGLETDDDRERFLREFWRARPDGARSSFRGNVDDARRYGLRSPEQLRVVHVLGKPSVRRRLDACGSFLRRLEIWEYDGTRVARQHRRAIGADVDSAAGPGTAVVFVQETNLDPRSYRVWTRRESDGRLVFGEGAGATPGELIREALTQECVSAADAGRLRRALEEAPSLDELVEQVGWRGARPWWRAEAPLGAPLAQPAVRIDLVQSGAFFRYTLLEGRVAVDPDRVRTLDGREMFDDVTVLGDIYARDRLVDGFRAVHHIAGARPEGELVLDFYRRLLPGNYLLVLRVEDGEGRALLREERRLEIVEQEARATPPVGRRRDLNDLTRADVVYLTVHPSLELVPPESFPVVGAAPVRAVVRGLGIAAVRFLPESGPEVIDEEAPFEVELTFEGRRSRLRAEALDADALVLARASAMLRRDARPFRVRFAEATAAPEGATAGRRIEVQVPEEEELAEVVCFHNGSEVARRAADRPPDASGLLDFRCPASPPRAAVGRLRFERAVAHLAGGEQVEAVFFPDRPPEGVDVRLADLFVSVLDPNGRPVSDLGPESFRVFEEGQSAEVVAVRSVERLPLSVSVMMDLSSSMGRRVRVAAAATSDFFDDILRDGDLASLFAFQHELLPLADFSGRGEELAYAADGLRAGGGTRLWDGLVFNLNSFVGLPPRRAVIVLSDGADTESDATVEEVAQALRLSGVLLFPVSIGTADEPTRTALQSLARQSGGQWFQARTVSDLATVYADVERILRGQIQITYRPLAPLEIGYRPVDVRVTGEGLRVRSVRGTFR